MVQVECWPWGKKVNKSNPEQTLNAVLVKSQEMGLKEAWKGINRKRQRQSLSRKGVERRLEKMEKEKKRERKMEMEMEKGNNVFISPYAD